GVQGERRTISSEGVAGVLSKRGDTKLAPLSGAVGIGVVRKAIADRDAETGKKEEPVSVLVVEDEPINRKIMVRMLRQLLGPSATIYEAADGTEAVDLCAKLVATLSSPPLPHTTTTTPGVAKPTLTSTSPISTVTATDSAPGTSNGVLLSLGVVRQTEGEGGAVLVKEEGEVGGGGAPSSVNADASLVAAGDTESSHVQPGSTCLPSCGCQTTLSSPSLSSAPLPFHSPPTTRLPNQPATTATTPTTPASPATQNLQPLSVIFMDIIMPIMDGYTASHHIRNMGISTPIVVTTANMPDEERGREVGVVAVVRKPFTKEKVKGVLERIGVM
ncbi:hypothetical protein HK102_000549, partial [Quaeritorhiza haematococci]